MSKSKTSLTVAVDLEIVEMKTTKAINGISIVTETVAHKDIVVELHKKNLETNA